ncbi:MAG TPA: hypothetical protein DDY92_05565 [Dialister sp.]|nr:hypothetical protein [Dialister sp.]
MHQEYDPGRQGWSLRNEDGYEVSFTPDMQRKKKKHSSGNAISGMGALFIIAFIFALIQMFLTQPLLFIIPAVLYFIYRRYRYDQGTMGLVAKGIKYIFLAFIVFEVGQMVFSFIF